MHSCGIQVGIFGFFRFVGAKSRREIHSRWTELTGAYPVMEEARIFPLDRRLDITTCIKINALMVIKSFSIETGNSLMKIEMGHGYWH